MQQIVNAIDRMQHSLYPVQADSDGFSCRDSIKNPGVTAVRGCTVHKNETGEELTLSSTSHRGEGCFRRANLSGDPFFARAGQPKHQQTKTIASDLG